MTTNNYSIVTYPSMYVDGFEIDDINTLSTDDLLYISAGAARDSTNSNDIVIATPSTMVNPALNGINGLDIGTLPGGNVMYNIYAIADSTKYHPPAFIMSLSAEQPLLPSGYNIFRRIGAALWSGAFWFTNYYGKHTEREALYSFPFSFTSSLPGSTYVRVPLRAVPNVPGRVHLQIVMIASAAGGGFQFCSAEGLTTRGASINSPTPGATATISGVITVPYLIDDSGEPYIIARSNDLTSCTLYVQGYKLSL